MKLRNKKTGEIRPAEAREDGIYLYDRITEEWYPYGLKLLAEWWEYYTGSENLWIIADSGEIVCAEKDSLTDTFLELGLAFETKEDAEKAVEKLKAWKRLKDKGLRFLDLDIEYSDIHYEVGMEGEIDAEQIVSDLDLLFGGKE